jgi:hypothetical protein
VVGGTKQLLQMRLDREVRKHIVSIGIRLDQRGVGIYLLTPD